jgi:hypothetical protein
MIQIHKSIFISHRLLFLEQKKRKAFLALEIAAERQDQENIILTQQGLVDRLLRTQFLKAEIHRVRLRLNQVRVITAGL